LIILSEKKHPGLLNDLKQSFAEKELSLLLISQVASAEIILLNYVLSRLGIGLIVGFTGNLAGTGLAAIPVTGFFIHRPPKNSFFLEMQGRDQ